MKKIRDRELLGITSGLIGGVCMMIFDLFSYSVGFSKRLYSEAAAGVWTNNRFQSRTLSRHLLGSIMTLVLSMLGGIIKVTLYLTKNLSMIT